MLKKSGNHPNRKKNGALSARRLLTIYLPQLQTVALRRHAALRKLCEDAIKKLQSEKAAHRRITSADPYFEPFRIAAKTKHPDTVHVALNGIQNLVAGGYLTGERMVKMSNAIASNENEAKHEEITVPLIDIIVKTVCECADIPHSTTQLTVINTLLNLCTCGTTEVHGESLTMVIMSLYYIFLNSKDWDVQTSATATLTQTMSILFARVESVSTELTQLQDEMKRIEAQRKREEEQQKAKEDEQKTQKQQSQDSSTNDDEYIMVNAPSSVIGNGIKESGDDMSTDNDYNAEELIEQIPLTSVDVVGSILQNMINNVTAAEEHKIKIQTEQQNKLKIVRSVINDMVDNSLQIHIERLADAYKRRGNQEYSKQHHRTALKYYQTAHKLNPRTPIYLVNMGITHYVLGELDHSHRLCVEAVKVGKKNSAQIQWIAKAFSTLAHVAYKQQKISACIRYYRLSLSEYNDAKIKRKLKDIIQEFGDATTDTNDLEFWEKVSTDSNYNTPEHTPGVSDNTSGYQALSAPRKTQTQLVQLLSKLYKDCWVVLEELCKLAAKQKVDKSLLQNNQWSSFLFPKSDNELINIRSRSLSLRLINSAMHNVGPHLSSTKKFISLIRTNLVPTLCANVTSTIESIIQMAMSIFKALVERFKHNLVSEIGVLFDSFLLLASSPNSTFQQKLEVLKVLSDICNDGHTTVSLFLNYDCSDQATRPKVFQHIISTVEHINNTKLESRDWINEEEANSLRTAALKCFVTIMQSLVDWQVNRSPNSPKTETPRSKSSRGVSLKPLPIKSTIEKPKVVSKSDDTDDLVRTGSLSSMNGGNVHGISPDPPPQDEEKSVSLSTSEMEFPFNSNTHNYHDIFVSQKKKEETFRNGVVKFNIKPTHGVKYLVQYGLLENKPLSVARFLRTTPTLDKTAVGEYIGGDKKFQIEVMHLYIDSVSFERMSFVDALRYLCSLFMLPGEAQKIDRIIERFAARFCQENTNKFTSGDVAYILAYSVILLHSNIYNDNVKKKMTCSEFIKTCKNATTEVSDDVLSDIYDNICSKEMKLKRADHDSKSSTASSEDISPSKKMMKLHQESRLMIRDVKKKIRDEVKMGGGAMGRYIDPNDTDNQVCKLIFSASCYAVLATFSVVIETSEFRTHITECYSGYRACIKLAAHLGMDTECEAFVNSLYRFTLLGTLKSVRLKNVEAMKLLLEIGNNDGNLLRSSWKAVIKCCSEIDILHLMATQAPADGAFWLNDSTQKNDEETATTKSKGKMKRKPSTDDLMQSVRETGTANHESRKLAAATKVGSDGILRFQTNANAQLVSSHIDQNTVAKVFTGTEKLAPGAIIEFVTYLCEASSDEIMNHANPRSFCLQKIVDIAHFNMHRVRFEWIQLWAILSVHFVRAGCHRNQQICIYAIDNLKQLADKFLEREELTTFNFQKDFLKPFLTIVARTQLADIREYIIQCIARLIAARYKNIKSGWKCVFGILGVAARVDDEHLVGTTFDIMIQILDFYFPMIAKMSTRPSSNASQSIFKIPETEEVPESEEKIIDKQIVYESEEQKQEHISKIQLLRIDAISDCVDTLLAFVANKFTDLSISAVDHISKVAQYLFESDQYLPQDPSMESDLMISIDVVKSNSSIFQFTSSMNGGAPDLSRPLIKAWFLCLLGLSKGVNDSRLEVRTHCLQVLFRLLRVQGQMFDNIMWQRVFERLLFPIFAELRQTQQKSAAADATPPPPNISSTETPMPASTSHRYHSSYDSIDIENRRLSFGRRRSESVDYLANSFSFDDRIMSDDGGGVLLRRAQSMAKNIQHTTINKPVYDDYSWLETTCHPALSNLVELFHQFFFICHPILHDVVSLLCTFVIMKQSSDASQIGHQCLKRLIQACGPKLNSTQWTIVIADLIVSLKRTIPSQLKSAELRQYFEGQNDAEEELMIPKAVFATNDVAVLCHSQLLLINTLAKITRQYLHKLSLYQCVDILNAFQISQDFITSCTKDAQLMAKLKYVQYENKASSSKNTANAMKNLHNLIYKLEASTFDCALNVLFECKNAQIKHLSQMNLKKFCSMNLKIDNHRMSVNDIRQLSEYRLIPLGIQLMQLMYVRERKQLRSPNDTQYLVTVVSQFLQHLLSPQHFDDQQFMIKIRLVFPYLSRLCECEAIQIRQLISKILLLRVSKCILENTNNQKEDDDDDDEAINNKKQQQMPNGSYHLSPPFANLAKNNSV
eukprot:406994_1